MDSHSLYLDTKSHDNRKNRKKVLIKKVLMLLPHYAHYNYNEIINTKVNTVLN